MENTPWLFKLFVCLAFFTVATFVLEQIKTPSGFLMGFIAFLSGLGMLVTGRHCLPAADKRCIQEALVLLLLLLLVDLRDIMGWHEVADPDVPYDELIMPP